MVAKIGKYLAFFKIAFKSELKYWPILLGRLIFFGVLMTIFSNLWEAAFKSGLQAKGATAGMLWYLAGTEWIVLSVPGIQTQIEDDVRDGSLGYHLGRPVSYIVMRTTEAIGQLFVRLLVVGSVGFPITYFVTGIFPPIGAKFPIFCILGVIAAIVALLYQATIGFCAMWLEESTPLYWIWQKFLFLLGGLMLPLTIYPEWLQTLSSVTPFYAMLFGTARLLSNFQWGTALETFILLIIWGLIGVIALHIVNRKSMTTVTVTGG